MNHADSLGRKSFFTDSSLGRKQEIAEDLTEAKYDGQSRQKTKIDGLVHISCVEERCINEKYLRVKKVSTETYPFPMAWKVKRFKTFAKTNMLSEK